MSQLHLFQKEKGSRIAVFSSSFLEVFDNRPDCDIPFRKHFLFTSALPVCGPTLLSPSDYHGEREESPLNGMMTSLPWWAKWGPYSGQPQARGEEPLKTYSDFTDIYVRN